LQSEDFSCGWAHSDFETGQLSSLAFYSYVKNSWFCVSDRTVPSVLLWTAIPESQLQLDNQVRTVQATNNLADVMIYLDFSQPVLNSSHQLQSVLQPSTGNLIATNQSSLGNRRFGFMVKIYF
jgi:hypothetical protein